MTGYHLLPALALVVVLAVAAVVMLLGTIREVFGADRWPPDEAGHLSFLGALVGLVGLTVLVLMVASLEDRVTRLERSPEHCARKLGIAYTIEHGATERLDAFADCTGDERYR